MLDPTYARNSPWQGNEERLTGEALAANAAPGAELAALVRPPLPRVQLFPPRYGYRQEALGIADVVTVDALYGNPRVDYSQSRSGYQGTSFPSLPTF